jgi:hypothetical protein
MKFMNFVKRSGILIANENTNEEFVIISDWNFCISPKRYLQFDIWTLIDLHKLYWIFSQNLIKGLIFINIQQVNIFDIYIKAVGVRFI